ncbi:right-handed parallel beta-helix repeat-containing protein [Xanthomarina sp. F1114]|uniref:parallel beta-helix domain-containing protein n=1 Tax=Xanthomarina sp. F1114 TaxID=2996019 RepID=UPI00225E4EF6|nr:parallel beta-helix domain-containing protein [Xanthomarina sp. F1114]MCX7548111.1 right-handed parallel beta-helix repeat-containing protein [Xanthomarina sp. F1114]
MKKLLYILAFLIAGLAILYVVIKSEPTPTYQPARSYIEGQENAILSQFLLAKDSTVIELAEGHFTLKQSLSLDGVNHVTIRGKGMGKTVLNFKGQTKGAEGIRITNSSNITIQDLTVENAKGDNIKVMDTDGISFKHVESSWTGEVSEDNGAYAFYPVLCKNVLIDNCKAIASSDAGIYVGQSVDVVISNNEAFYNVAGIESENSINVKIFGNKAYENTGGILVFDLPGLTQYGSNIEVYNNLVYENNTKNFAKAGAIVGQVPSGTGSLVLSTEGVYFHDNTFKDNKTASIAIASYELIYELGKRDKKEQKEAEDVVGSVRVINDKYTSDTNYNPYPRNIRIGKNIFSNSYLFPTINNDFGKILMIKKPFQTVDVLWDGLEDEASESTICFEKGTETVSFFGLDVLNDFKNATSDVSKYICK